MRIALIVAAADNHVIGSENALPWHLPADMAFFKATTLGKPVVMGRKTYESIGRPLPGRPNIVITRNPHWAEARELPDAVTVCPDLPQALKVAADKAQMEGAAEVMIIGGAEIYKQALPLTQRVYLTRVHCSPVGDAYFSPLASADWQLTSATTCQADTKNPIDFTFQQFDRVTKS